MVVDKEVQDIEARLLLEAIYARYGYDFREYTLASVRRRLLVALARSGCAHLGELQHRILRDAALFAEVLDDLGVRVTEMFRDPAFYRALRYRIVPILRTYPWPRLWLSGCATGEEVYAVAIVLTEEGIYDRCQIYATDLSGTAIEQAKEGIYSTAQETLFADNYRMSGGRADFASYHTAAYGGIAMRESLRKNVLFFQHNLVSDHIFGEMTMILCRNVLIYFQRPLQDRVISMFHESLCPGGFLCLGLSERLSPAADGSFNGFAPEERIYRRDA